MYKASRFEGSSLAKEQMGGSSKVEKAGPPVVCQLRGQINNQENDQFKSYQRSR